MIHKYFKDPRLIELLTLFVAPFGMTREQESFIIWSFNEFSYHVEGAWYPKGGAGAFTGGLAKHYEKNGGKFMLNTEVVHIDIDLEKRMAKAVICKDKSVKKSN
jgi:phytoene dehydrogenase-like protein